jgi:hypothetical protein
MRRVISCSGPIRLRLAFGHERVLCSLGKRWRRRLTIIGASARPGWSDVRCVRSYSVFHRTCVAMTLMIWPSVLHMRGFD